MPQSDISPREGFRLLNRHLNSLRKQIRRNRSRARQTYRHRLVDRPLASDQHRWLSFSAALAFLGERSSLILPGGFGLCLTASRTANGFGFGRSFGFCLRGYPRLSDAAATLRHRPNGLTAHKQREHDAQDRRSSRHGWLGHWNEDTQTPRSTNSDRC